MVELFDAPEALLGSLNIQDCGEVVCIDLKMLSPVVGRKISGVIGMNFLKKYVVQINFDKGTLLFLQPTRDQNPHWGKELMINYDSFGTPGITGTMLNGVKVRFDIDTGANITGNLESMVFKEVLSKKEIKTSEALSQTAAGLIHRRETRINDLSIGLFEYQDLIFGENNRSCLGLSFLSRHIVTFDFPNGRVYFEKGKEYKKVDETDMSGLHLLRISNETIVYLVDEGSPAQKAGVKAGDVILKLGNKDAKTYDIGELRGILMSGDKHKIMMKIKRSDDVKEVSFLLKKKI